MIDSQIITIEDVFTLPQQKFLNDHFDGIMLEFARLHQTIHDSIKEMRAMNDNLSERLDKVEQRLDGVEQRLNKLDKVPTHP